MSEINVMGLILMNVLRQKKSPYEMVRRIWLACAA